MHEINLVRGDTLDLEIGPIYYEGTEEEYILADGEKLYMDIKVSAQNKKPIFRKEIVPDVEGKLKTTILPADTEVLTFGDYHFDVRLYVDDEHIYTVIPDSILHLCKNITDFTGGDNP